MAKEGKITKEDKEKFFDLLVSYNKEIVEKYGHYNWDDNALKDFCKNHNIKQKGKKSDRIGDNTNLFWFDTYSNNGVNDTAWHFLRHIRNAIAHSNIRVMVSKKAYFIFDDFNKSKNQNMHGQIEKQLFWTYISVVKNTLQQTNETNQR